MEILKGVFTSFLRRAYTVCSQQHQQEEIEFLIKNFTDNGYKKNELVKIANEFRRKRDNPQHSQSEDNDPKQIVFTLGTWTVPKTAKVVQKCWIQSCVQELHELEDSPHITQQIQATSPKPTGCLHDHLWVRLQWKQEQGFNNTKSQSLTKNGT